MGITVGILSFVLMLCGTYVKAGDRRGVAKTLFGTGLAGSLFFVFVWLWAAFETENSAHQDPVLLVLNTAIGMGILSAAAMLWGIYLRIGERGNRSAVLFVSGFAGAIISLVLWSWAWRLPLAVL
jgi:uncharacterized membrane protein YedE/YeeE